ncbi:MAG TPA: LacI family DNA-binding transcriptional regulator [Ornithinibacter sp.]|nr:LacI family DNA-binding transcriptional regulator [Ornithinibacter sp.]
MRTPARRRRPTLEQVARHAGVSRATVSRVVNGSTTVDPALREVVNRAVEELDYVPNAAARALMTRRTDIVTLVAAENDDRVFGDPFFAQIVRGVSHELTDAGVQLSLSMTQSDDQISSLTRYLSGGHTDGVLLISEHGGHRLAEKLVEGGIPVVIGGRPLDPGVKVPYVDNDNVEGGRLAAQHLRERGRRRIATIAGPEDMSAGRDRLEGFRQGLGREFRRPHVEFGHFTTQSGAQAAARLLERVPDVDAIFVASDLMALGAMSAIRRLGRHVPDDIAIVGFDDIDLARLSEPALTTVRQRTQTQGHVMARMLLRQLANRPSEAGPLTGPPMAEGSLSADVDAWDAPDGRGIVLRVDLIERAST